MKKFFLLSLILFPLYFFGQSKQVWLYEADNYYHESDYASALKFYKKAQDDSLGLTKSIIPYQIENTNQKLKESQTNNIDSVTEVSIGDYLNHQIGMCYFLTFDYSHASNHFVKTINIKEYPEDKYYYALSLMNVEKYDTAMAYFEDYIQAEDKKDSLVKISKKHIQGCYFALSDNSIKKEKVVTLADTNTFNKGTSSFATMFWGGNKIMFTSARKGGVLLDREKQDSKYLCDLYWSQMSIDNEWSEPVNFGRPLNSSLHDASGVFNNNNVLFYTKWSDENREDKSIYLARMIELKFFESYKLDSTINVAGYKSVNPFVTMDGSVLYFSSNRPGGKGGMDLWKIDIDKRGNSIGNAVNLGDEINTSSDEISPFFHQQSSTLFFSSNGHASMGGLDIFKSEYNQDYETYGLAINMGAPINSSKDDAYMVWDELFKTGFLSSDRKSCESGHCYNIYQVENAPIKISIEGFVYDVETTEPIPEATVVFKDIRSSFEPFNITTDSTGFYSTELSQNAEVFMKAKKKGYFADAASVDTRNITESKTLTQDFFLSLIPKGEVEIPDIEYDYDDAKLRPQSKETLDKLVDFLNLNDNLTIEILSHSDSRGDDDYNLKLSNRRAASVVNYLVAHGINKDRLTSEGKGETEPLDDCSKYEDCGDTGKDDCDCHQKNRRTAFKTTSEDYEGTFGNN